LARKAEVYSAMRARFLGIDIVPEVVRLYAMNLYLHDIAGGDSPVDKRSRFSPIVVGSVGRRSWRCDDPLEVVGDIDVGRPRW
jgi:hypothetical protein